MTSTPATRDPPGSLPSALRSWLFTPRSPLSHVAIVILTIHTGLLASLAVRYSPTVDEVGHLPAGLYTWEFGRFDVYRVNPPLVRTIVALPVWLAGPEFNWSSYRAGLTARPEWDLGRDLIQANGKRSFQYFTWARWTLIPMSLLGAIVCWVWASQLYGPAAGVTALILWCFSPTVLAYGTLITPDLSAAALGVTAAYLFWRWLSHPTWTRAVVAGLTLGLVQLTKTTWIILFALWPLLWLMWLVAEFRSSIQSHTLNPPHSTLNAQRSIISQLGQLAAILVIGLYVLNVSYGFDGTFQRLEKYRFVSHALSGREFATGETETGDNRFVGTWFEEVPVPLPRDYVTGIDLQKRAFERGQWSYLRGAWKHGGWWWYYLYAIAVKEPLGTWCLLGLAVIAAWKARPANQHWTDALVLLAPGFMLFAFVSSQTGINRYVRYVLPALPFAFIWASQAVRLVEYSSRWWTVPVGGALLWSVASSVQIYPHSLSYFNEAVGGPANGHEHLIDANIDWGQDLFALRDWRESHPQATPLRVACQPFVPLDVLGIRLTPFPDKLEAGWYIVSRHDRHRRSGEYASFDKLKPVDHIGESMDVYHITPEDAAQIR